MTPRFCAVGGCGRRLHGANRSGFCVEHKSVSPRYRRGNGANRAAARLSDGEPKQISVFVPADILERIDAAAAAARMSRARFFVVAALGAIEPRCDVDEGTVLAVLERAELHAVRLAAALDAISSLVAAFRAGGPLTTPATADALGSAAALLGEGKR